MGDDEREPKKGMVKQRKRKGKMFIIKGVKINKNNNNENFGFEPKKITFSEKLLQIFLGM